MKEIILIKKETIIKFLDKYPVLYLPILLIELFIVGLVIYVCCKVFIIILMLILV